MCKVNQGHHGIVGFFAFEFVVAGFVAIEFVVALFIVMIHICFLSTFVADGESPHSSVRL